MRAVHPSSALLVDTGFDHDRAWLVIDEDGMFVTQRQFPAMARIRAHVLDGALELSTDHESTLRLPIVREGPSVHVTIWGTECAAVDQGEAAARMLTRYLGRRCRLVRMHPNHRRHLSSSYGGSGEQSVGFADSSPLMLIGQASLDDLNTRLALPVSMDRFRPNLVIAGGEAFQEDRWSRISIGEVTLKIVKDCIRCEIPTIDQATGEKGVEPIETLENYRAGPYGTRFGRKVVHESLGTISVGDEVTVLE